MSKGISTDSAVGRTVLMLGHVAGMLDLVILPLWVGGMMRTYNVQPQVAGGIVTLFLVGVLASNGILSRLFGRIWNRPVVIVGYALSAAAFFAMTRLPFGLSSPLTELAVLHFIAGIGVGAGLSCVHGTIARSGNPHRNFAIANLGVGIFAIAFFAITPPFLAQIGVNAVFFAVFFVTCLAILAAVLAFPENAPEGAGVAVAHASTPPVSGALMATLAIGFLGVVLLQTAQAATTSFAERVGDFRGFGLSAIGLMFAVNGFVALTAPVFAGVLQNKLSAVAVAAVALVVHGLCSITIMNATDFYVYSAGFMLLIFATIFGHTFIFGLFAKLDPTGRMNASTPSMLMLGTAIGPALGGTIVQFYGFPVLGFVSGAIAIAGAICFLVLGRNVRAAAPALAAA